MTEMEEHPFIEQKDNVVKSSKKSFVSVLDLGAKAARQYFLKGSSFCRIDLPEYFVFSKLLSKVSNELEGKKLSDFRVNDKKPRQYEDVNYSLINNKDGRFSWRPLEIIHPAIYISLINKITEEENWNLILQRFQEFQSDKIIQCVSIPVQSSSKKADRAEQVLHWWSDIEQKSLELGLEYRYIAQTDISDCYSALYTHAIAWALHTKEFAKAPTNRKDKKMLGNQIDWHIQDMHFGQTNGIPQGSVLMDFVAEIVLGKIDQELREKLSGMDSDSFQVLRYRDDYRIFSNSKSALENIIKKLSEVLVEYGLRLSKEKTFISESVVENSIKEDKKYWILQKQYMKNPQKYLLLIYELAKKHPNSGSLERALTEYHCSLMRKCCLRDNILPLISIVVEIALSNPRTYPVCAAIISKLLSEYSGNKGDVLGKIIRKFQQIPNTGILQIWLQRIALKTNTTLQYSEKLCEVESKKTNTIWNSEWLNDSMAKVIQGTSIFDPKRLKAMDDIITPKEVSMFLMKRSYY